MTEPELIRRAERICNAHRMNGCCGCPLRIHYGHSICVKAFLPTFFRAVYPNDKEDKCMEDRCGTCPYLGSTACTFYVLGGNWHCARENVEGQNIVEVRTYTITGMEDKP